MGYVNKKNELMQVDLEKNLEKNILGPKAGFTVLWVIVILLLLQSLYAMTNFQIQYYYLWFKANIQPSDANKAANKER
ncbi:MAG: hypothetical protein ACKOAD_01915 [Gammaproteobacteria bacterium]